MIGREGNVAEGPSAKCRFACLVYAFFLFHAVERMAPVLIGTGSSRTQFLVLQCELLTFLPGFCRNTSILREDRCNNAPYCRQTEKARNALTAWKNITSWFPQVVC
jgi:hypothetical protein